MNLYVVMKDNVAKCWMNGTAAQAQTMFERYIDVMYIRYLGLIDDYGVGGEAMDKDMWRRHSGLKLVTVAEFGDDDAMAAMAEETDQRGLFEKELAQL